MVGNKVKNPIKTKKPVKAAKSIKIPKSAEVPKRVQIFDFDAYSPSQIASRINTVAFVKAKYSTAQTFWMGINAGVYIALGAQFATLVISDSTLHFGLTSLMAGIVFSLGLILVVVGGAELFTGNCLIIIGYVDKKVTSKEVFNNWTISFIGNLIGSLIVVCFMYQSHQWEFFHDMVGAKALLIANKKVNLSTSHHFTGKFTNYKIQKRAVYHNPIKDYSELKSISMEKATKIHTWQPSFLSNYLTFPWHCLYFFPEPHGQTSLRPIFLPSRTNG